MKWVIDEDLLKVDLAFCEIFKYLNLIRHVNPTNVEEERRMFFSGERRNPVFRYKKARGDVSKIRKRINSLSIPEGNFGKVYERVREDFLRRCDIIENIGKNDCLVKESTAEIYGWPNKGMVDYARKLLVELPAVDVELDVSSSDIFDGLRKGLDSVGLIGWMVKYSKKRLTTTKHTKKIFVCRERMFSKVDVNRLVVHEVGVHAVRYANGHLQPLKIFGIGFPDFLRTEEGMATYFEELTGNSSGEVFRNYAGRVIAIDCLRREFDFKDCFEELLRCGFSCDDSWNLCVRVYRGGGFVKDHVYLEGYLMVKKFAEEGGDFRKLYVGKVGLDDLELVDDLLLEKKISMPRFLPEFVD